MATASLLIAEKSLIIRKGLISIIDELNFIKPVKEIDEEGELTSSIEKFKPDFVIINYAFFSEKKMLYTAISKYEKKSKFIILTVSDTCDIGPFAAKFSLNDSRELLISHLKNFTNFKKDQPKNYDGALQLTTREKNILKQIALGLTNKEISDKLFISPHTVITHRKNITRKLNIKTISGLTVYAILNNLICTNDL